ncbi:hypothetical protein, partial [Clostridium perfringens]
MNDDINIDIKITNKNSKVLTLNDYKAYLSIIENRFLQDNNIKSFIDNAKFIMELVESEFQLKRCNL